MISDRQANIANLDARMSPRTHEVQKDEKRNRDAAEELMKLRASAPDPFNFDVAVERARVSIRVANRG